MVSPGIVNWYEGLHGFTFDDYRGETRDEVIDLSADDYFDKIIDDAKGFDISERKRYALERLKGNANHIEVIKQNNLMISGANKWFDNKLESDLKSKAKEQYLINDISPQIRTFNSEEDLNNAIKSALDNEYTELKKAIRRKQTAEEAAELISLRRDLIASYKEIKDPKADKIQRALDAAEKAKVGEATSVVFEEL